MKKTILSLAYCSMIAVFLHGCGEKTIEADYAVVPLPQAISKSDAEPFALKKSTAIVYPKGNDTQKQTAEFLSEFIKINTGLDLKVTDEEKTDNVIILKADYQAEKPESYNLVVDKNKITINGSDEAGTFYGVQTLRKSIPANAENHTVILPAVDIKDYPRFKYRGMHLDVARHMFPVEFIKKYIDILALHNINHFHWHISDDQGWRIEIKKHPKLTEIGSKRAQTVIGKNSGKYDGKPYGGYYTQEEAKEVVAYAQKRFITVIPEIDLPGHMLAVLTVYPNLGCTGGPYKVAETWGIFDDVLCAGNDDIFPLLNDVFAELIEIFPSEYIHVGGDECPKVRWEKCPKCQAKIKQLGLKKDAHHTAEQKLQSYVIKRVEEFISSKGRKIIGWDEILEGGIAPNSTILSWQGLEGGIEAARQHHDVIMAPTSYAYLDYYQTKDTGGEPFGIGGYVPVEKVYSFEPMPAELTPDQQKYIIGLQANCWTEYMPNSNHVEYMVLPRMAALSEVQWLEPEKKDYMAFLPRLANLTKLYTKLDYNFATHIFDLMVNIEPDQAKKLIKVKLSTFDNAPVYYTLDGTEPTENSLKYEDGIEITTNAQLKAVAVRETGKSRIYNKQFNVNKATFKDITLINAPVPKFLYGGAATLVDGMTGSDVFTSGEWLGFGQDFVAVVDLGESTEVSKVTTGTFIDVHNWIFGATEYIVEISSDNKSFKKVYDQKYAPLTSEQTKEMKYISGSFPTEKGRYVKITAKSLKSLPDWSSGKGRPASIFVDEILIE